MITIKEILKYEGILLQIEEKSKFEMQFPEIYHLKFLLSRLGDVTNYLFFLQDEHYKKYHDTEKLKEYHDKLMGGYVNTCFDMGIDERFLRNDIENLVNKFGDEETKKLYYGEDGQ